MSAPAGWYADPAGVTRWWDGQRWIGDRQDPQVAPGTSASTPWIWLIVLLPLVTVIPMIGYFVELVKGMAGLMLLIPLDGSRPDPIRILAAELGLFFTPWALILTVSSWAVYGLSVWFSAKDVRALSERGFASPFPWPWSFLSSVVYVIGRHVVIRRRGGAGSAPFIVTIVIMVASFVAGMLLGVVMIMALLGGMVDRLPEI